MKKWMREFRALGLTLLVVGAFAPQARAQGARKDDVVLNSAGQPLGGVNIAVCSATATIGTSTTPCSPLVNIYTDATLTTTAPNPFTTDGLGNYGFWAPPGTYQVQIYGLGSTTTMKPAVLACSPSSNCTLSFLNNIIFVDGAKYPFSTAGVQAALTAGIAQYNAGTGPCAVDARGMPAITITSEIDVGNSGAVPCTLYVSNGISWACSISDGTSYCLKIFNKSAALAFNSGGEGNPFVIALTGGANVAAICGNDSNANYVRMEGISCSIFTGSPTTVTQAAMFFQNLQDSSRIAYGTASVFSSAATISKLIWGLNNCCGATFDHLVADAGSEPGVTPCTISGTSLTNGFIYQSGSCVHAGNTFPELSVTGAVYGTTFTGLYMETNATDTTTPCVLLNGSVPGANNFIGGQCAIHSTNSNQYVFERGSGAGTNDVHIFGFTKQFGSGDTHHGIQDDVTGKSYNANINSGAIKDYDTEGPVVASLSLNGTDNLLLSATAPTISSGFGTSPSIVQQNGTAAFEVNVGTGGVATSGVIGMPTAANGWSCTAVDMNTNIVTRETAFTVSSVTFTAASAWTASDKLLVQCGAF